MIDADDTIRLKEKPSERYHYKMVSANSNTSGLSPEAYNDYLWFALSKALANLLEDRFLQLNVVKVAIPLVHNVNSPHTSIYVSRGLENYRNRLMIFPDGEKAEQRVLSL